MPSSISENKEKPQVFHIAKANSMVETDGLKDADIIGREEDSKIRDLSRSVGSMLARLIPKIGPWYKNKHLIKLNTILSFACLASSTQGYDGSLINVVQAFPEWQFDLMRNPNQNG